jgi:hypothetical protein
MRRFVSEFTLQLLNKTQITNGDRFRPEICRQKFHHNGLNGALAIERFERTEESRGNAGLST